MRSQDANHVATTRAAFDDTATRLDGYYDADPNGPRRHSWVQMRVRKLLRRHLVSLSPVRSVADLGCGRGDLLDELAATDSALEALVGVDFSPSTVALARRVVADRRITFVEGTLTALPLGDALVDVAICVNALHHLRPGDLEVALGEFARVARQSIVVEIKNRWNPYYGFVRSRQVGDRTIDVFATSQRTVRRALARHRFRLAHASGLAGPAAFSPIQVLSFTKSR